MARSQELRSAVDIDNERKRYRKITETEGREGLLRALYRSTYLLALDQEPPKGAPTFEEWKAQGYREFTSFSDLEKALIDHLRRSDGIEVADDRY
jgi:hypothetical protein